MNFHVRRWRLVLRVLVLALIVAAVPLPSAAQQASPPGTKPGLKASIPSIVRTVASLSGAPARPAKQQATDAKAQLDSRSFFRTPAGVAVLAVMAAGTGYAIYSARHDRIQPTGR